MVTQDMSEATARAQRAGLASAAAYEKDTAGAHYRAGNLHLLAADAYFLVVAAASAAGDGTTANANRLLAEGHEKTFDDHYERAKALVRQRIRQPKEPPQVTTEQEETTYFAGLPLRLSFSPKAIRKHFEDHSDDPLAGLTDADLAQVGSDALQDDDLYATFAAVLRNALDDCRQRR